VNVERHCFFFPDELNSILFLFLNDVYLIDLGFLLPNVVGTVRNQFGFFTSEAGLVEGFAFTARNQARETVDASDETAAVAGDGETGVGPELGGGAVGGYFGGALEAHHGCKNSNELSGSRPKLNVVVERGLGNPETEECGKKNK
jgi:hypothetical protein